MINAHNGLRSNRSVADLIRVCDEAVSEFYAAREGRDAALLRGLGKVLALYRFSEETEENRNALKSAYAQKHIRITKRTENPFTPLVKLFFGSNKDKSDVSRYASVLRFADASQIMPDDLDKFVADKGGIVACYRKGRRTRASALSKLGSDDILELLRAGSVVCTEGNLKERVPDGVVSALLELRDGEVYLLDARHANDAEVRRHHREFSRKTETIVPVTKQPDGSVLGWAIEEEEISEDINQDAPIATSDFARHDGEREQASAAS